MAYDNYKKKTKPVYMTPTLYADFKKKREAMKAGTRSAINKANKSKAGPSTHRCGCISAAEHAKRMNGELPSALGLFVAKYTVRDAETGDFQFRSPKSAELYAKIMAMIEKLKEEGKPVDENVVYYEATGGYKKGGVFGVGTAADMFFQKPHRARSSTPKTTTYVPSMLSQLSTRLSDAEELLKKEREDKEAFILAHKESEAKLRADVLALQDLVKNAIPNCHNAFNATPPDPRDPTSGGGGGGNGSGAAMELSV